MAVPSSIETVILFRFNYDYVEISMGRQPAVCIGVLLPYVHLVAGVQQVLYQMSLALIPRVLVRLFYNSCQM